MSSSKNEFLDNINNTFSIDEMSYFVESHNLSEDFQKVTGRYLEISNGLDLPNRKVSNRRKQSIVGYKTEKYLYETALIGYFDAHDTEHYYGLDMNSFINNYKNEFAGSHKYYFATNEFDSYSFSAYGVLEIKKYYNGVSIFDRSISEKKITYYSLLSTTTSTKEDILDGGVIFFGKA